MSGGAGLRAPPRGSLGGLTGVSDAADHFFFGVLRFVCQNGEWQCGQVRGSGLSGARAIQ